MFFLKLRNLSLLSLMTQKSCMYWWGGVATLMQGAQMTCPMTRSLGLLQFFFTVTKWALSASILVRVLVSCPCVSSSSSSDCSARGPPPSTRAINNVTRLFEYSAVSRRVSMVLWRKARCLVNALGPITMTFLFRPAMLV